jgi:hypothetical protein
MSIAGYVSVCVQLYCVGFLCLSLHASAYMAIFKCVRYVIFICLKDSASPLFSAFFSRSHILHVSICVFFLFFLRYFCCFLACVCLNPLLAYYVTIVLVVFAQSHLKDGCELGYFV